MHWTTRPFTLQSQYDQIWLQLHRRMRSKHFRSCLHLYLASSTCEGVNQKHILILGVKRFLNIFSLLSTSAVNSPCIKSRIFLIQMHAPLSSNHTSSFQWYDDKKNLSRWHKLKDYTCPSCKCWSGNKSEGKRLQTLASWTKPPTPDDDPAPPFTPGPMRNVKLLPSRVCN